MKRIKTVVLAGILGLLISIDARAEIKNLYANILDEYDIHPPALQCGYPLWYQYDSLPITGIIFLKKDLDDLYRMDKVTYVAEPTKENAEIILNFSGEIEMFPKFYIVPDSNLTWNEVATFIEGLTYKMSRTNILLCGSNNVFVNIKARDGSRWPREAPYCGWSYEDRIVLNSRDDLFYESWIIPYDTLSVIVSNIYNANYAKDVDFSVYDRKLIDSQYCVREIKLLEQYNLNNPDFHLWDLELKLMRKYLRYTQRYKQLNLLPAPASLQLTVLNRYESVSTYFRLLDLINEGVYRSREKRAYGFSKMSYAEMFNNKMLSELEYVHLEFPDMIAYDFYPNPDDEWGSLAPPLEIKIVK